MNLQDVSFTKLKSHKREQLAQAEKLEEDLCGKDRKKDILKVCRIIIDAYGTESFLKRFFPGFDHEYTWIREGVKLTESFSAHGSGGGHSSYTVTYKNGEVFKGGRYSISLCIPGEWEYILYKTIDEMKPKQYAHITEFLGIE